MCYNLYTGNNPEPGILLYPALGIFKENVDVYFSISFSVGPSNFKNNALFYISMVNY